MTEELSVKKRNGDVEPWDISNIVKVIKKAAKTSKEEITDEDYVKLGAYVSKKVKNRGYEGPVDVEDIQNAVEESLMKYNFYETEKVFHDYRKNREKIRFRKNATVREMQEKLNATNVINSNANLDERSYGGRKGEMASTFLKEDAIDFRMDENEAKSHKTFERYKHDVDSYSLGMPNCLQLPCDKMFKYGVYTRQVFLRGARSINAQHQLGAVYIQLQSLQQFGGVSYGHWDWSSVPYFRMSFQKNYFMAYLKTLPEFLDLNLEQMMFDDREEIVDITYVVNGEIKTMKQVVWVNRLEEWIEDRLERFNEETGLKDEDFFLDNKENLDPVFYQSAKLDTINQTKQAVESLLHNLNSLQSRSGNQLPFSSINYGTCTLPEGRIVIKAILDCTIKGTGMGQTSIFPCQIFQLKDGVNVNEGDPNFDLFYRAVQSSAKRMYPNYANCDWSVDVAGFNRSQNIKQKVLTELSAEQFRALSKVPLEIQKQLGFVITDDAHFEMNKDPQPFEMMATMGCRTYNGFDINFTEDYFKDDVLEPIIANNELKTRKLAELEEQYKNKPSKYLKDAIKYWKKFEIIPSNALLSGNQKDGRGNIVPETIVLPTVAMMAKKKAKNNPEYVVDYFMDLLDKELVACRDELIKRFNWCGVQSPSCATFTWKNNTMLGYVPSKGVRSAYLHGTLAIGQVGMAETLQLLIGCDQCSPKGMELAKQIEQKYKDFCAESKEVFRLNFGNYYTPAESLAGTSYNYFLKKNGLIENVTAYKDENGELKPRGYFTNSIHVPVWTPINPYQKIDIESQLTGYSSAGCITYVEIGDNAEHNIPELMNIIRYAKRKDIPYFAVNVKLSSCEICNYTGYIPRQAPCPVCGASHEHIADFARITGYLSMKVQHFNNPKQMEEKDRYVNVNNDEVWVQSDYWKEFKDSQVPTPGCA